MRAAGTGVGWDAIISPRMHLFSAMFLLVMLAGMPSEVRVLACNGKKKKKLKSYNTSDETPACSFFQSVHFKQ